MGNQYQTGIDGPLPKDGFEHQVQHWRRKEQMEEFASDERQAILNLRRQMLKFVPAERVTAEQVLKSEVDGQVGTACFPKILFGGINCRLTKE